MSGGGGGIIIVGSVVNTANMEMITENLTPAEAAERDAITSKLAGDICVKDVQKLNALIVKALRRCK
jgi:hypothetical protein